MSDESCYLAGIMLECGVSELSVNCFVDEVFTMEVGHDETVNIIFGTCATNPDNNLQLGETSTTAYRGDRGKIAYDHSRLTGTPHVTVLEKAHWNFAYSEALALPNTYVASTEVRIIKVLTAAQYAALNPKIATTMYVIVN